MANTIKVQLVKGLIGTRRTHRATVRGLGLRRVNSVSELEAPIGARHDQQSLVPR